MNLMATKISAGVSVGIGERAGEKKGDEQFEISDSRSVNEVLNALKSANLQAVMGDSVYIG